MPKDFVEAVIQIAREDPRYDAEAYLFLREALDYTVKRFNKPDGGPARHVSGRELLDGIREYALEEFGPMARRVLNHWGIRSTEDCGELVFNMVDRGMLGKTEEDKKEDFRGGYDFTDAFETPFLPPSARTRTRPRRGRRRSPPGKTGPA